MFNDFCKVAHNIYQCFKRLIIVPRQRVGNVWLPRVKRNRPRKLPQYGPAHEEYASLRTTWKLLTTTTRCAATRRRRRRVTLYFESDSRPKNAFYWFSETRDTFFPFLFSAFASLFLHLTQPFRHCSVINSSGCDRRWRYIFQCRIDVFLLFLTRLQYAQCVYRKESLFLMNYSDEYANFVYYVGGQISSLSIFHAGENLNMKWSAFFKIFRFAKECILN